MLVVRLKLLTFFDFLKGTYNKDLGFISAFWGASWHHRCCFRILNILCRSDIKSAENGMFPALLVRCTPQESNLRPFAPEANALSTELGVRGVDYAMFFDFDFSLKSTLTDF